MQPPNPRSTIRPPPRLPVVVGKHEVVRALAATTTCAIDHAITRGPFGFARDVVLKRVLPGLSAEVELASAKRLLHEAAALARVSHPAIVRLYEVIEHDGSPVLVLEHVEGLSLAKLVDDLNDHGSALDDTCAFYIGHRVASALASAHAAQPPVFHGDVSATNVLIPWDGHVKLVDFDLAGTTGGGEREDVADACRLVQDLLFRAANVTSDGKLGLARARPDLHPTILDAIARGLRCELMAAELATTLRALIDVETVRERLVAHLATARERHSLPRWFPAPDSSNAVGALPTSLAPVAVQPRLSDISTVKTRPEGSRAMLTMSAIAMALGVLVVVGAVLVKKYPRYRDAFSTTSAASDAPPPAEASVPATTHEPATATMEGRIVTAPSESDHRVFVDGHALGHEGQPITVRCGAHTVKIGTTGTPRTIEVPCGGEVRVAR